MRTSHLSMFVPVAVLGFAGLTQAALINTPLQHSDLTVINPAVGGPTNRLLDGGLNSISYAGLNEGNTAVSNYGIASVGDFAAATNFTVTGTFNVTTNENGSSATTTNRMGLFGIHLFGTSADVNAGVFATFVAFENRTSYTGTSRLGVGTNRPNAGGSYVGNAPENGLAESGGTFLTGGIPAGLPAAMPFTVSVSYDTATQVDVSFSIGNGTNTATLVANNLDITGLQLNNGFGVFGSARNRSLAGTFTNVTVSQVPEPVSLSILSLAAMGGLRRRR